MKILLNTIALFLFLSLAIAKLHEEFHEEATTRMTSAIPCPSITSSLRRPAIYNDTLINLQPTKTCSGEVIAAKLYAIEGRGTGVRITVCSDAETRLLLLTRERQCDDQCVLEGTSGSPARVLTATGRKCPTSKFASTISFYAPAGTHYILGVAGLELLPFELSLDDFPVATNAFCNASRLLTVPAVVSGNLDYAPIDNTICPPNGDYQQPRQALWYRFDGTNSTVVISACGQTKTIIPEITVFEAPFPPSRTTCEDMRCLQMTRCSNASRVLEIGGVSDQLRIFGRNGYSYFIRVSSSVYWQTGAFTLTITNVSDSSTTTGQPSLTLVDTVPIHTAFVRSGRYVNQTLAVGNILSVSSGLELEAVELSYIQFRLPSAYLLADSYLLTETNLHWDVIALTELVTNRRIAYAFFSVVGGTATNDGAMVQVSGVSFQNEQALLPSEIRPSQETRLDSALVSPHTINRYIFDVTRFAQSRSVDGTSYMTLSLSQARTQNSGPPTSTIFSSGLEARKLVSAVAPTLTVAYLTTEPIAHSEATLVESPLNWVNSNSSLQFVSFELPYLPGSQATATLAALKLYGGIEPATSLDGAIVSLHPVNSSQSGSYQLGPSIAQQAVSSGPSRYYVFLVTDYIRAAQAQRLPTATFAVQTIRRGSAGPTVRFNMDKNTASPSKPQLDVFF